MIGQQNSATEAWVHVRWVSAARVAHERLVHYTVRRQWLGRLSSPGAGTRRTTAT
jgi:hypothetical protein